MVKNDGIDTNIVHVSDLRNFIETNEYKLGPRKGVYCVFPDGSGEWVDKIEYAADGTLILCCIAE